MSFGATKKHLRQKLAPVAIRGLACVYLMSIISRTVMHLRTLPVLTIAFLSCVQAEPQTLTDKQGRSIKAEVVSVSGDQVRIKRDDGQTFDLPLSTLSEADQQKLTEWAKREAAKPLPADAITVLAARAKFNLRKTETPQTITTTYSDGTTSVTTKTLVTTNEQWGYSVTVTNRTLKPIDGLRAEYRLFSEAASGNSNGVASLTISAIKPRESVILRTSTVTLTKTNYKGESSKAVGSQLSGIWLRIYRGDQFVYETSVPETLRTTEKW